MQNIKAKSIFSKIEEDIYVQKEQWDYCDLNKDNYIAIINKANQAIKLIDYLQSRYVLSAQPSSSGWSYKTFCPFHKNGNERTASFFINSELNRYYCQACGVTGGIVEFISRKYGRPSILVASFILNYLEGKIVIESEQIKKIDDSKKFNEFLISLSDLYRNFISLHRQDDEAIEYIMKCMNGFDNILNKNKQIIQNSTNSVLEQINLQLKNYNIKRGIK